MILEDRKAFFLKLHDEVDLLEELFMSYEATKATHTGRGTGDWDALEKNLAHMVVKVCSVESSVDTLRRVIQLAYEFTKSAGRSIHVL